ncbi:hypothetical protein [Periweissella beninensis]|uniref:hypothetical protein n=1 Tax=Periweissella beninensis TaxID=504936 RepID=UPI0021A93A22|nr:hypothetical protein [Periweissella beninensis]MCT4396775.1 hypothetical protein [Periweissella beninensis]
MDNLAEIKLAIANDNPILAYGKLEEQYIKEPTFEINRMLSKVALNLNKYDVAEELVNAMIDDYLREETDILFLIKVYCENMNYLELNLILRHMTLTKEMHKKIKVQIDYSMQQHTMEIKKNIKQFKYLGIGDMIEQNLALKAGKHIPMADFIKLGSQHLIDEDVHPLVRATILEIFTQLGQQEVNFKWLDNKTYTCDLQIQKEKHLATETSIKKEITQKLAKNIQNEKILLEYVSIFSKIIFPYFSKVIPQTDVFVNGLINRLNGEKDDYISQNYWIKTIDELLLTLNY